jgi:hypothetical protein
VLVGRVAVLQCCSVAVLLVSFPVKFRSSIDIYIHNINKPSVTGDYWTEAAFFTLQTHLRKYIHAHNANKALVTGDGVPEGALSFTSPLCYHINIHTYIHTYIHEQAVHIM